MPRGASVARRTLSATLGFKFVVWLGKCRRQHIPLHRKSVAEVAADDAVPHNSIISLDPKKFLVIALAHFVTHQTW